MRTSCFLGNRWWRSVVGTLGPYLDRQYDATGGLEHFMMAASEQLHEWDTRILCRQGMTTVENEACLSRTLRSFQGDDRVDHDETFHRREKRENVHKTSSATPLRDCQERLPRSQKEIGFKVRYPHRPHCDDCIFNHVLGQVLGVVNKGNSREIQHRLANVQGLATDMELTR